MYNKSDNHIKETMLIIFMILFWGRKMSMKFHHDSKIMDFLKIHFNLNKISPKTPIRLLVTTKENKL